VRFDRINLTNKRNRSRGNPGGGDEEERRRTMKTKAGKRKYKIEFRQTETFVVDLYAKDAKQAEKLAQEKWNGGKYYETGDCGVELHCVYDVTNTDDPFDPIS
jgi:hypothetical protein